MGDNRAVDRTRPTRDLTGKGRATRDRIVESAATLMYERGVAATSLQDVQRAAPASASQIYHYFGDKAGLTRAVIAHQTEAVLDVQGAWMSRLDSVQALEAWRDYMVESQRRSNFRGGCPIGSLASELADGSPRARAELARSYLRWQRAIRDGLSAMQERGELKSDADPEQLSLAMLSAIQGGLLITSTQRDTRALEAAITVIIDGIRRA